MRRVIFFLVYLLIPALIFLVCIRSGNWYMLFGVLLYFAGIITSEFKQWIFFPIPIVFAVWYWYTYGLGPTDLVFFLTACLLAGVGANQGKKQYDKFVSKVLPEQMSNIEYNEKVDELNRRIDQYRKDHPGAKITPEIIEEIRTEVFF